VEETLRKRLAGAIVLVVLAVIFVPAVLDGPDGPVTTEVGLALPAPEQSGAATEQHRYTLEDPAAETPAGAASAEPERSIARAAPSASPSAPQAAAPAPAAEPTPIEAWAVQVGSFASRENAERLSDQLTAGGFAAFIVRVEEGGRVLFRVRVGPEQDRARAEVLAQRLAGEVEATPKVVQHP